MKKSFFILTLVLSCNFSNAQNSLQYLSSTTGAACQAIKYYNGYVLTGTGSTLRSYYVGSGATVPFDSVFEYRYLSEIIRMAINDHYLYVAANYDGMTKWDISNPALPVKVYDIPVDSAGMATQGIAIKGDTIFLAQQSKVTAYKDYGNSYSKITSFGYAPFAGIISGVAVKGNLLAYTVWQYGGQNGVYLHDANDFSFISFTPHGGFLTENVIWGKNNNLLHVMGGTNTVNGHFYTLNVSNPFSPQVVFTDTVLGFPFGAAMALPYNAENINDTIYVANWGGLKPGDLSNCYIRVYDATDTSNVHLLTYINAGLWHFDMTVHYPKLYVASEWYGIKTIDITDIMNPVDEGNTLTGGWNLSSDAWGNYMTVANEGYGFKLYDISDVHNPVLINVKNDPGFCGHANFSDDGQYIYTVNLSYQPMRVYRRDSMIQTGYIQQSVNNGRFIVHHDRIFSKLDNSLLIIDVSDPYNPFIDSTITMTYNDMALANDVLYISSNDSIWAYDVSGNNFSEIVHVPMLVNQDAKMLAAYNNKIYVYITNKGLTRYTLEFYNPSYSLAEDFSAILPNGSPSYIAADTFGLYLAYRLKGLYAIDRQNFAETGYYRGGLDYRKYTDIYGVRDLFGKDGKIFFVEYFAQTTILSNDTLYTGITNLADDDNILLVYPNPAYSTAFIFIPEELKNKVLTVEIFDLSGKRIETQHPEIYKNVLAFDCASLNTGIYLISVRAKGIMPRNAKLIKY
ncbi:MAG: T9SS type A sorting domain-containing protein [Bacteroidota bacterium]